MTWEVYESKDHIKVPCVTIYAGGQVRFNMAFHREYFGDKKYCQIHFNSEEKKMGFVPREKRDSDGMRKLTLHGKNYSYYVNCRPLLRFLMGKLPDKCQRFAPTWYEGKNMVVVDLNKPLDY